MAKLDKRFVRFNHLRFVVDNKTNKVTGKYINRKSFDRATEILALKLEQRIHVNSFKKRMLGAD